VPGWRRKGIARQLPKMTLDCGAHSRRQTALHAAKMPGRSIGATGSRQRSREMELVLSPRSANPPALHARILSGPARECHLRRGGGPDMARLLVRRDGPRDLDAVDERMIRLLQRDGRVSQEQLAREVHLSRPAVHERLRRLERVGAIHGYRAMVDWEALG